MTALVRLFQRFRELLLHLQKRQRVQVLLSDKIPRFTDAGHRVWFLDCEGSGECEESTRLREIGWSCGEIVA
jgi:hypothetical protein